ncbi:MAG: acyltransferase [Alphaproteobacteria bacterium]|nr:acyltransferase [Alphaproteobacteria bacterium]
MSSASLRIVPRASARTGPADRLADLDRAKGLAILLVVFGHLVARDPPQSVLWYEPLRVAVYLFHMPLFMYLSGYVTFLCGAATAPPIAWPTLLRRRAIRLLLPFLAFGLAVLCGKLIASTALAVDNAPSGFLSGLASLLWDTQHSPATSAWYLVALFSYCAITPPLLALDRSYGVMVAVAALLYVAPLPPILYLDRIGSYYVFFVAGLIAAENGKRWRRFIDEWHGTALAAMLLVVLPIAAGWVTFEWREGAQGFPYKWALLLAGSLALPGVHGLVRHGAFARSTTLAILGRYVFVIYLFNTILIGLTKALLLKAVPWNGTNFLSFAATLMVAGTLGPILLKRTLLARIPMLDRATD